MPDIVLLLLIDNTNKFFFHSEPLKSWQFEHKIHLDQIIQLEVSISNTKVTETKNKDAIGN